MGRTKGFSIILKTAELILQRALSTSSVLTDSNWIQITSQSEFLTIAKYLALENTGAKIIILFLPNNRKDFFYLIGLAKTRLFFFYFSDLIATFGWVGDGKGLLLSNYINDDTKPNWSAIRFVYVASPGFLCRLLSD